MEPRREALRGVALEELRSAEIRRVYVLGAEGITAIAQLLGSDSHVLQEGDEVVDIQDIGDIVNGYFLPGEQYGAEYLQHLVLGPLRADFS